MSTTLLLLLAALPAANPTNLDFSAKLAGWQGTGFTLTRGYGLPLLASSADTSKTGKKAILHRTFTVPADAHVIRFSAALVRPSNLKPGGTLGVVLEAANREFLPRQVRSGEQWKTAPLLLEADAGKLREYQWLVSGHTGKTVRIALVDQDDRVGCHVVCAGFEILSQDQLNAREFAAVMQHLAKARKMPKAKRYDSEHFIAFSTADPGQSEYRLYNCETIHALFFRHFRKKGFTVTEPKEKLMVAMFHDQSGMNAYMGQTLSTAVTGLYHPASNRLVIYDYAKNKNFVTLKSRVRQDASRLTEAQRQGWLLQAERFMRDHKNDTNISTVMHEVAHQLSFNCGLLNRQGDVPVWLAEGLATYCEPTVNGAWQGIGEPNPMRAGVLKKVVQGKGSFLPLKALVTSDNWMRKATRVEQQILGYSQSWALFRLLMEKKPKQMKAYLETIHSRKTPDRRLADFTSAFGDLTKLEKQYQAYLRQHGK